MRAIIVGLCLALAACGSGAAGNEEPEAAPDRLELTAYDFGYELEDDTISAGKIETVLVNEGDQPHQALLYRLRPGVAFDEFKKKVMADESLLPQLAEGGVDGLSAYAGAGEEISSTGDELAAGNYAVICFVRDQSLKTTKNHAELGMIARLTVE